MARATQGRVQCPRIDGPTLRTWRAGCAGPGLAAEPPARAYTPTRSVTLARCLHHRFWAWRFHPQTLPPAAARQAPGSAFLPQLSVDQEVEPNEWPLPKRNGAGP